MVGGHPVLPLGVSLVPPAPPHHQHHQALLPSRAGWVGFLQNSGAILWTIATNLSQNVPVGHFVNFSEHKTCTRKLHASVNMYPEVKKIPRAQKAARRLFPNAL